MTSVAMGLEAHAPPAVRDEVKLMVARAGRPLVHASFLDLPDHLRAGDLLIVNASATIPAALPARRPDGTPVDVHLSTPDPSNERRWVVEVRCDGRRGRATVAPRGSGNLPTRNRNSERRWLVRLRGAGRGPRAPAETLALPAGGTATLLAPYLSPGRPWIAKLDLPEPVLPYLSRHGAP